MLFLDEPTAGVDVHNRGLFWELIQEEAGAGVTVFVTTHFLEEVDYCDWVCFIDAGRLIANATPEELRQRYSDGYRDRGRRCRAERRAARRARSSRTGATIADDRRRSALAAARARRRRCSRRSRRWRRRVPEARRPDIEQPQMTDIFRRVLLRGRRAA